MSITFTTTEVPSIVRVVNPYIDGMKSLVGTNKALTGQVPIEGGDAIEKAISRAGRLVREAGKANGVTGRSEIVPAADGKSLKVTFWAVPKIVRKAKSDVQAG